MHNCKLLYWGSYIKLAIIIVLCLPLSFALLANKQEQSSVSKSETLLELQRKLKEKTHYLSSNQSAPLYIGGQEHVYSQHFENQWVNTLEGYIRLNSEQIQQLSQENADLLEEIERSLEKELNQAELSLIPEFQNLFQKDEHLFLLSDEDNFFIDLGSKSDFKKLVKENPDLSQESNPIGSGDLFYALLLNKKQNKDVEKLK